MSAHVRPRSQLPRVLSVCQVTRAYAQVYVGRDVTEFRTITNLRQRQVIMVTA